MSLAVAPASVHAQGRSSVAGDGLMVALDWWNFSQAGGGYRPVRVQITNTTTRVRPLRIAIESSWGSEGDMDAMQSIELPAGGKADFVISVPLVSSYDSGTLHIYERGRKLNTLMLGGIGGTYWAGNQSLPSAGVIASSTPDLRNVSAALTQILTGQNVANNSQNAPLVVKPADAPTKWIDYTMLDLAFVSIRDLDAMSAAAREALIQWTLCGGNLYIYGIAGDREASGELNRLLDLDRRMPRPATWQRPKLEDRNAEFVGQPHLSGSAKAANQPAAESLPALDKTPMPKAELGQDSTNFSVRQFGFGQIAVSSQADPFPGTLEEWGWLIKTLKSQRVNWHQRHGVIPKSENDDFWNFLIPGVGRAPVTGFQVLITLFALVIGPVNYYVLRRRRQLYFLIATVPTLAFITTILLLGYAVTSDGFTLRGRVRSVTLLDQVRRESVSWSRVSYYAGVAPSGGLRFSTNTAVYPIRPPGSSSANRSIDWTDGQTMPVGWLRSRTPTQLLTIHTRHSEEQLTIATSATGSARLTNDLGTPLRWVMVSDDEGRLFRADSVAPGEAQQLNPVELGTAQTELRKWIADQPLDTPAEIAGRYYSTGFFGSRPRFWFGSTVTQWDSARSEELIGILRGVDVEPFKALVKPRSYMAVTDQPPTVDLGVTKMQDEGSLFIVIGYY